MRVLCLAGSFCAIVTMEAGAQTAWDDARAHMAEGRFAAAAALLEAVVEAEPANAAAWNMLGAASNYDQNYRRANEAAERAVALAPETARYRFNRALTRAEVGDFEGALADFDFVLAREPRSASALTERGAVLVALGRFEEAELSWTASLEANADYIWVHFYRGQSLMIRGRYGDAAAAFERVLAREDFYPARLWSWIAHRRAGLAPPELQAHPEWPGPIAAHLRNESDIESLAAAARGARLEIDDRRLASAYYFAGQKALLEGDPSAARLAMERAVAVEAPMHAERAAAVWELENLR